MHKIIDKVRRYQLLKQAKEAGPAKSKSIKPRKVNLTIEEAFKTSHRDDIIRPKCVRKHGSTRHYSRYNENIKELQHFNDFLMNFTGGCQSATEARQIVIDVSKAIAYCSPSTFTWRAIFNHQAVKAYFDQVQQDGIGPDGIITKIDRICHLLKYLSLEVQEFEKCDDIPSLQARFEGWKASFKKEKLRLDQERQARNEGKNENALQSISTLFSNKYLLSDVQQIVLDAESSIIDENDATKVATYLFLCLTYKNMQRPAPAINLTLQEAEDVREGEDNLVYVLSKHHKTARSLGPARLGSSLCHI